MYIEKLSNFNNKIVELGNIIDYKIIIKNLCPNDYTQEIIVTEYLSEFVNFELDYKSKDRISFNYDKNNNKILKWNIGKLKKGEETIIGYFVKVINGKSNDTIESIGYVEHIPSAKIKILIGNNLNEKSKNLIVKNFNKLKEKYKGKELINEIYKKSFNFDMKFDKFDITKLISNTQIDTTLVSTIYLDKNNSFYNSVLNKYWSSLMVLKHQYIKDIEPKDVYHLKYFGCEDSERRSDFIYAESFITGDILIY